MRARPANAPVIAVVLPCYRVARQIVAVLTAIGPEVHAIYVVDDKCPEGSGDVAAGHADPRVAVLRHAVNQGVGGAMITGFAAALRDGADIIVKIDGDGQMDPRLIPQFVRPIVDERADYTKGNRFFNIEDVRGMPRTRLFGNLALSFLTKLSTGYWSIFDPNNGYVAIDARALSLVPLEKLSRRYFFESDMLFRLNTLRARVLDMPMRSVYGTETSGLKPLKMVPVFFGKHMANFGKRLFYSYYLRDFSLASLELMIGSMLFGFGLAFGLVTWIENGSAGVVSTTGTVMLSVLPILTGMQLLLAFFGFDMANAPAAPISCWIDTEDRAGGRFDAAGAEVGDAAERLRYLRTAIR